MFRLSAILIICITLIITGCNGSRESEEYAYIMAMGLDKADQPGMIKVTYQIATPKIGGEKEEGGGAKILTNVAPTLAESLNILNSTIALSSNLSQIKVIIIGEDLAKQGIMSILAATSRFRDYRGSMFFMVTKGQASDFLEANKPIFNISPAKYYELMLGSGSESGYYLRTSLHQFYVRLKSKSAQPYAVLVSVNPLSGKGTVINKGVSGEGVNNYKAGELPRLGGDPVEFVGTAVFREDQMVGSLDITETRMLAILLGEFSHGYLSMNDPLVPKEYVNVNLHLRKKPDINASFIDGKPVIGVKIELEGEFTNIPSGINYEQEYYLKIIESEINRIYEEEMLRFIQHTQELNTDVAGFGYYFRSLFSTYQQYSAYDWNNRYQEAEVHVEVNTKIRRNGLMIRTIGIE